MIICGTHVTSYAYDVPVTLERHAVRLQPRTGGGQHLRRFDIVVSPAPAAQAEAVDLAGNALHLFWFLGPATRLTITTRFEVETRLTNPFDFIPSPAAVLPLRLTPDERDQVRPCLDVPSSPPVDRLAQGLAAVCDGNALGYVVAANGWINQHIAAIVRPQGPPWPPEVVLAEAQGACRDQAVLLAALCRAQGIPARFVSGYCLKNDGATTPHELHAWAEAWIPGGGWRGFDPTLGLAVAERHVAVAAAPAYALAAPVAGSFRGYSPSRLPAHAIALRGGPGNLQPGFSDPAGPSAEPPSPPVLPAARLNANENHMP